MRFPFACFLAIALTTATALAGPTPVIELPDGVTGVPLHRDATLPAYALVDGEQLVGVVHGMKGNHGNVPRLTVLDLNGKASIEMGRITRADGTLIVSAGIVFYDDDRSPRIAVEGGKVLRIPDDGPLETVGSAAKIHLVDAKGKKRATSDATCTELHDAKGSAIARICGSDDGVRIHMERRFAGALKEDPPPVIGGAGDDEIHAHATPAGFRFIDRKGRGTKLADIMCRIPPLAVANVGTIRFKQKTVAGGVSLQMLP